MKTILAATDFTPAAHNACLYAASLAREFKARLILFSAYDPEPTPTSEIPIVFSGEDFKDSTELGLAKAAQAIQASIKDIRVETLCRQGIVEKEINKAAREIKADIIVAGMKSHGRGFRKIFGSTVTALARKSELPLIVVPEGFAFVKLDTIALANDHDTDDETDAHLLDMLCELGERFSSRLYLVRIVKTSSRNLMKYLTALYDL